MKTNVLLTSLLKASFLAIVLCFSSCEDEEILVTTSSDGFFIVNEGSFGGANTSLSFFDRSSSTISNNVFETVTGTPLGDQAQSMTVYDDKGFIVVQNSAKVEVINSEDYTTIATISEGVVSPRYLIGVNNETAYLSDWGADGVTGTIKVIDLDSYEITNTISTGSGTNQMVMIGDYVYAANSGGWGYDNTVVVIDTNSDKLVATIEVGDNPSSLVVDSDNNIWVSGNGSTAYNEDFSIDSENSTPAFMAKINTDDNTLSQKTEASEIGVGPSSLNIDASLKILIFKYEGNVSTMSTSSTDLSDATTIIENVANIYGMGFDTSDNRIILTIAPDFSSDGSIRRYELSGTFVDEYTVGIAPNGIAQ